MPYMFPDLTAARAMKDAGASCIMPLAAPIGSNKGLVNKEWINILLDEIDLPIIVDAGIGKPSEACAAMEMGVTASWPIRPLPQAETSSKWQKLPSCH